MLHVRIAVVPMPLRGLLSIVWGARINVQRFVLQLGLGLSVGLQVDCNDDLIGNGLAGSPEVLPLDDDGHMDDCLLLEMGLH